MLADQFKGILGAQIKRVRDVLVVKTGEYATDDQLANIRFMAIAQGVSMPRAVVGAMAKHTFSVYKMVRDGKEYPIEVWDEKITDHIIWLILLRAAIIENVENPIEPTEEDLPC